MAGPSVQRVLFVASECFPLLKTGGLADVAGALPLALADLGLDVRTLLPGFPAVMAGALKKKKVAAIKNLFGGPAKLLSAQSETGLSLFILDAPHLFDITGNPYLSDDGENRPDNDVRYAGLSKVAADLALGKLTPWGADVVHTHDWQAGLTAAYLQSEKGPRPKTVFTIHNLAFQGLFPKSTLSKVGLSERLFTPEGLEYWGKMSFLKAGIVYSDHVTTVSPTYAQEITTSDGGMGFGGLLKNLGASLSGIVNGIDIDVWNPETDPAIPAPYSGRKMAAKAKNKRALQKEFGLKADKNAPLFTIVSRLTEQKGLNILLDVLPHLVGNGAQLFVLGSGDAEFEAKFQDASKIYTGMVATYIGYSEPLSHKVQAAADFILIPSRFEPCGLTQLYGMRYGTLPIVSRVGGLADTVIDANLAALQSKTGTGIQFSPVTEDALRQAIDRALTLYGDKALFKRLMRTAMHYDVSWQKPAEQYHSLYSQLLDGTGTV